MAEGCGKPDNNGKEVSGAPLLCGVKLTYGTGKETKRTVIHLCRKCEEEKNGTVQTGN